MRKNVIKLLLILLATIVVAFLIISLIFLMITGRSNAFSFDEKNQLLKSKNNFTNVKIIGLDEKCTNDCYYLKPKPHYQNIKIIPLNDISDNFIITKCDNDSTINSNDLELKQNCNYQIVNTSNQNEEEATIIIYKDKNEIYHQK
jgi:hypothetical protein